jgi:hypothetical protein
MVVTNFDDARKFLSQVPNLDYGGCGIAALSMYRWVVKNENEKPEIVLLYRPLRLEPGSFRKGPSHCGIKYNGKIIDQDGEICLDLYSNWMKISEDGMLDLLNRLGSWNSDFKRRHVPKIGENLGIDLSDICLNEE